MEVIAIESKAFQEIMGKIDQIDKYVKSVLQPNIDDIWVDSFEVCSILKISQKTLQRLRDNGEISYSKITRRTYYSLGEIKRLLQEKRIYVHDADTILKNMIEQHKIYYKKNAVNYKSK